MKKATKISLAMKIKKINVFHQILKSNLLILYKLKINKKFECMMNFIIQKSPFLKDLLTLYL